jgi:uncharacterized membrane protein
MKIIAGAALLTLTSFAALPVQGADPRGYEFITVDLPDGLVPGGFYGGAGGINDRGWIVGSYMKTGVPSVGHAFLDTGRTFTTIDALKAIGVNNRGTVVGIFLRTGGVINIAGFVERNGKFTVIDVPGLPFGRANGISNNGTIVGWVGTRATCFLQQHGFVRNAHGEIAMLELDFAFSTYLTGVNNEGVIVGYYDTRACGGLTSFIRQPSGEVSPIQVPGASETFVNAINGAGDVAGSYQMATATHGFVLDREGFVTIDAPGASSTEVTGINNHGEIDGQFNDAKGLHLFVARPQEEGDQDIAER